MEKAIVQVVVGVPVEGPFDYLLPEPLRARAGIGSRVYVPFGGRRLAGVIVGFPGRSAFGALKTVLDLLDDVPSLDPAALAAARDVAAYYGCTTGEACTLFLPRSLHKRKKTSLALPLSLAEGQASAWTVCHDYSPEPGGAFWMEAVRAAQERGEGVLILVPEVPHIKSIKALLRRAGLAEPAVLDRRLTVSKELDQWLALREGRSRIAVGTRSAVFAPVAGLGLVVLIDEDNQAYQQEQAPAYHAREILRMRSRREGFRVVAVSPAPSAEIWAGVADGITELKTIEGPLSPLQLIDLGNYKPRGRSAISFPVTTRLQEVLTAGGKAALFLNRRGRSTMTKCNHCGEVLRCPRCAVTLAYREDRARMFCGLCGWERERPEQCPSCQGGYLRSLGAGIERIEEDLARMFPGARIGTFDSASEALPPGELIVGTNALERSLDRLNPALIIVVDADAQLSRMDFRCAQQFFSFLIRLRRRPRTRIMVQTTMPDHYALKAAVQADFAGFYREELNLRREVGLPPYQHLLTITLRGEDEAYVQTQAQDLYRTLQAAPCLGVEVMDAQPDIRPKLRDQYRFVILLKGPSVDGLLAFAREAVRASKRRKNIITTLDVD